MLYLAFRFDLRFAPGVVLACVHDALVVLGAFVIFHKEVTLSTIAAVLTIVGYSMNDTVVVYDRIRENLGKHRGKSFSSIINMSISETLSRTILTSGATMLSVLAFFIWGTGVIKDFAFAMVVGIIAGTYSSIYVAAPLTEWIDTRMSKQDARRRSEEAPPRRQAAPEAPRRSPRGELSRFALRADRCERPSGAGTGARGLVPKADHVAMKHARAASHGRRLLELGCQLAVLSGAGEPLSPRERHVHGVITAVDPAIVTIASLAARPSPARSTRRGRR